MPIVDIEIVRAPHAPSGSASARALADALGRAFDSAPGHTWVRLRTLDAAAYAENETDIAAADLPVFVSVLHAQPPLGAALDAQVLAVTHAVAQCLACKPERVHVLYAPAGAGRQAFGGTLVRS